MDNGEDLRRDKHDVLRPLHLPRYHAEDRFEQEGDWVLVAVLESHKKETEGVPVMETDNRMFLRRHRSAREVQQMVRWDSAARVGGGWALNLRTGETVLVKPMR